MFKSCSKCGKIHNSTYKCNKGKIYRGGIERDLRNTNDWHKKADEIKRDSNYLCSICKNIGIYNYNNLEVHHIIKVTDAPERLLDNFNLICLCVEHHKQADKGEITKDYLIKLVNDRESIQHPPTNKT